jgi:hypothetical protein
MTQSLPATQSNNSLPTKPSRLSPDTEQLLAAGEGQGNVGTDANGHFAGAAWAPPKSITAGQEHTLRSDLAALEATLKNGCDVDWVYDHLGQLAAVTATRSDVTEQEYGYKLKVMAHKLSEYPASVVQAACERYPLECKWFPELADIIAYADAEMAPLKRDKARIQQCLTRRQKEAPRKAWRPPTQADKDYARELVAGLKAKITELDEAERKANREAPSGIKPARRGLLEGPGQRAARMLAQDTDEEANG